MKNAIVKLLTFLAISGTLISCQALEDFRENFTYVCYPYYNPDIEAMDEYCELQRLSIAQARLGTELDISAEVADINEVAQEKIAVNFSVNFGMSLDKAMKLAKNIQEFNALEDRTEEDIADFAERLYGTNPTELVEAVSAAQLGNNQKLDHEIEKAAARFEISKDATKALIKELHGHTLISVGIRL